MNKVVPALLFFIAATVAMSSCQKELSFERSRTDSTGTGPGSGTGTGTGSGSGTVNTALVGDWQFVVLNAKEISGSSATIIGHTTKIEDVLEYTTTDNTGTLSISAAKFDLKDLAYKLSATRKGRTYVDGAVQAAGTSDVPISDELPPTSSSTDYKGIGADSLNFTGGDFISFSLLFTDAPSGVKYKIDGNNLTVTLRQSESSTDNSNGFPLLNYSSMEMKFTFKKP